MQVGNLKEIVKQFFDDFFESIEFFERDNELAMRGHRNNHVYDYVFKLDNAVNYQPDMVHHYLENIKGEMVRSWQVMKLKELRKPSNQ